MKKGISRKLTSTLLITFFWLLVIPSAESWGFWAHKRINRIAVFTLPPQMITLYKENIEYLTDHAVDPDKRRYAFAEEAPRHYIDFEFYGTYPYDSVPRYWNDAVARYTEDSLNAHGIVPWYVNLMLYKLTDAFRQKNKYLILKYSADIGHYIADGHVPLHCTENYNGQMTGQIGIHGFWESRVPELFGDDYDYFVGKAEYIEHPLDYIWKVVIKSAGEVDSVLSIEKKLTEEFPADLKYTYEQRGDVTIKTYSQEFSAAYQSELHQMQERKMREAIIAIGSFWYTAWVNAGKPDLGELKDSPVNAEEQSELEEMDQAWRDGKMIGRPEE